MFTQKCWLALLALCIAASLAQGGVVATTGAVHLVSPPASWAPGALESDDYIWGFYYLVGEALPAPETIPEPRPGTYLGLTGETFNFPSSATYPAGTRYDLFVLAYDPVGTPPGIIRDGTITFDGRLLYISDADGPLYGGIEGGDWVTISEDLRTLTLHFNAGGGQDQLFLAVASSVPEPGTMFLVGLGMMALFRVRRSGRCKLL